MTLTRQDRATALAVLTFAVLVYLGTVIAANVLTDSYGMVWVAPGLTVTAGTYAAGLALFARDVVQRSAATRWGEGRGRLFTAACIPVAGLLSWATTSNPDLAAASTIAFLTAEAVDFAVFTATEQRWGFLAAIALSNLVAAPVDTLLFLHLAGFPVTWASVTGQLIGKLLWVTALPLAVAWGLDRYRTRRA